MRKLTPVETEVLRTLIRLDPGIQRRQIKELIDFYGIPLLATLNDQAAQSVPSRSPAEAAVVRALLSHVRSDLTDEAKKDIVEAQKKTLVEWQPPKEFDYQTPKVFDTARSSVTRDEKESVKDSSRVSPKFAADEEHVLRILIKLDPGINQYTLRTLIDFYGISLLKTLNDQVVQRIPSRNSAEEAVVKVLLSHIGSGLTDEAKKAVVTEQKKTLIDWKPPKGYEYQAASLAASGLFRVSVPGVDAQPPKNTPQVLGKMLEDLCTMLCGGR